MRLSFNSACSSARVELGGPKPFFFDGPWHEWRREKAARASAAATQLDRITDDIERLYRDAPLTCIGEGTNEMQRIIIARQWIKRHAEI